jgi:hypothetical protein
MSINYIEANTKGRERLCGLASRLSDEELELQAGDDWTVAAILAHLAFWDHRVLELIRCWKKVGVGRSPIDIDNVNDAMKPLCLAIPGREAASLTVPGAWHWVQIQTWKLRPFAWRLATRRKDSQTAERRKGGVAWTHHVSIT